MRRRLALLALVLAAAAAAAGAAPAWQRLPAAPVAASTGGTVAVWTGRQLLVFGRAHPDPPWSVDVAATYDPAARTWQSLAPLAGPEGNYEGRYDAVWTGTELIVLGPGDAQAYRPATNTWRRLKPGSGPNALVVWDGTEVLTWGGGCCDDATNAGAAYRPPTNSWRKLRASPLPPTGKPLGAWDGRRLVVVAERRAAAYDPAADRWRRLVAPPAQLSAEAAVWDGEEVLFVGARSAAYDPRTGRWRTVPRMPALGGGLTAVRAGGRVVVWGGGSRRGAQYVPAAGRWFLLPRSPLRLRRSANLVWTGRAVIVWGGADASDGAAFSF